jgi:hypothetical protein
MTTIFSSNSTSYLKSCLSLMPKLPSACKAG